MTSSGATTAPHVPVLVSDVIAALALQAARRWSTAHSGPAVTRVPCSSAGAGRVIGFDRDPDAIEAGRSLVPDPRLELIEENFSQMDRVLVDRGIGLVDAIALDIGVSSMQLDRSERGFSFQADGPLDMRMSRVGTDRRRISEHGRGGRDRPGPARLWGGAARPGDRPRNRCCPSSRAHRASSLQSSAVPRAFAKARRAIPATRTFQAIRIHLNAELDELEQGLEAAERALKPGGRLAVVTFHSLEDRIVKRFFRERSGATPAGSRHRPALVDPTEPTFERVAKPVAPSERELAANPRARSARLRSAVRTSAPARKERLQ